MAPAGFNFQRICRCASCGVTDTPPCAIAFQALIAFVPLTLFALGVLGATGNRQLWTDRVAPAIHHRLRPAVFHGIDRCTVLSWR